MWEEEEEDGEADDGREREVSTDDLLLLPDTNAEIGHHHSLTISSSRERESISYNDSFSSHAEAASEVNHLNASTMTVSMSSLLQPSSRSSSSSLPKKFSPLLPSPAGLSSPPTVGSPITLRPKRGRPVGRPPTQEILRGRRKVNFVQIEFSCICFISMLSS